MIKGDHDIPTIGELVNRKRGKRQPKGSKATVPLEVIGMDIGHGEVRPTVVANTFLF